MLETSGLKAREEDSEADLGGRFSKDGSEYTARKREAKLSHNEDLDKGGHNLNCWMGVVLPGKIKTVGTDPRIILDI